MSRVVLNAKVSSISWDPDGETNTQVQVTAGGKDHKADVVLVTVSLGVLKEKAATMFNPALPPYKTNAIKVSYKRNQIF